MKTTSCSTPKSSRTFRLKLFFSLFSPPLLSTRRTKRKCGSSTTTWLRLPSYSPKFFLWCKHSPHTKHRPTQTHIIPFLPLIRHARYVRFPNLYISLNRHTLLDAKITNVLSLCHDQFILNSVQSIIQNMITLEDPSQQQPHYLQSVGFGALWRFAGPFTKVSPIFLVRVHLVRRPHLH